MPGMVAGCRAMTTIDNAARAEDEAGILWCYRFTPDGIARRIEGGRIDEELARPGGWTWVHLTLANHRCRDFIAERAPLSAAAREILTDPDEHLRLDVTD